MSSPNRLHAAILAAAFLPGTGCSKKPAPSYVPPPGFVTNSRVVYTDGLHNENTEMIALDDRIILIFRGGETSQTGSDLAHINVFASMDRGVTFNKQSEVNASNLPGMRDIRDPKLVLFTGSTPTACGLGQAAAGPFYCPSDEKVYIDLAFYRLLRERFHAPGDFAQAYVIAHEVGHHVQNLLGTMAKVDAARARASRSQVNELSVRLELQADCYAGVWAHDSDQMHKFLETGDLESALQAAAAIGDDTLQKQSQGYAVPETFTHGTSAQRVRWFRSGFDSGTLQACNTFQALI